MPFAHRLTSLLLATFITAGTASGAVRDIDKEKWTGGASNGRPAVGDEVGILGYGSDGPVALATVDAIHEDFDGMASDPPADSFFVAVDLTIENVGAESVTYDANDIDLVLDDGSILNSSLMSLPEEDPGPLSSDPVPAGDTTSGRVLFVVPDGAAVGGVVYDDFYNMAILAATDDFPDRAPGETLNWTYQDVYYGEEYDLDVTITDNDRPVRWSHCPGREPIHRPGIHGRECHSRRRLPGRDDDVRDAG